MDVREMARMGGIARKEALSPIKRRAIAKKASLAAAKARKKIPPEQREELARRAAEARWAKEKAKKVSP